MVWLACASARCSFDRDALRAEHHLHVGEMVRQAQQELDAAGKGDRLEGRVAGEQLLPVRLTVGQEFGPEHGERGSAGLERGIGEKIGHYSGFPKSWPEPSDERCCPDPPDAPNDMRAGHVLVSPYERSGVRLYPGPGTIRNRGSPLREGPDQPRLEEENVS